MSVIIAELLNGAWRPKPNPNGRYYDFMDGYGICIYSDWTYPKAEAATYELKTIDEKHFLEIKHTRNPIETEVYEILNIDDQEMTLEYLISENKYARITFKRFYLDGNIREN